MKRITVFYDFAVGIPIGKGWIAFPEVTFIISKVQPILLAKRA